jgi:hypothetical protein
MVAERFVTDELHEPGLLRATTTTFVHANGISDDELRMLANAGSSLSAGADVELKMGFESPMSGRRWPQPCTRRGPSTRFRRPAAAGSAPRFVSWLAMTSG